MSKEVGLKLRQERINKKLTIDDVVNKLKIRKFFVEAIESGNFSELPGLTYTIGFVKSYAKLLKIDVEPLVEILKNEKTEAAKSANVGLAYARMESALPSRLVIVCSLLALIIAYVVWYGSSKSSVDAAADVHSDRMEVIEKIRIEEVGSVPVTVEMSDIAPVADIVPQERNVAVKPDVQKLSVVTAVETDAPSVIADVTGETYSRDYGSPERDKSRIVIIAEEDSWIQIRKGEELIFSKVLTVGDKYYIRDYADDMILDTGNAGGIRIMVDGGQRSYLGSRGVVVRDFILSKEKLDALLQ